MSTPTCGDVWEVQLPSDELVLMMIREIHGAFVRAVPLSDFMRLAGDDDVTVTTDTGDMYVAHAWLEGPVRTKRCSRRVGKVAVAGVEAVAAVGFSLLSDDADDAVREYRKSVYEQIDPVFSECWQMLS